MIFLDKLLDENKSVFIQQNTEEWHRVRLGRFTASEIFNLITEPKTIAAQKAGHLSETALNYVMEKVAETLTCQPKQQGYAFPLVWGLEHEAEAVKFFEEKTNLQTFTTGFYPYTDHAGGSPDREVEDFDILEIKCPFDSAKHVEYLMLTTWADLKAEYKKYYWQCQANLLFTGRKACHFVSFDPRMRNDKHKMAHLVIPAIEEDQKILIAKIEKAVDEKLKILSAL